MSDTKQCSACAATGSLSGALLPRGRLWLCAECWAALVGSVLVLNRETVASHIQEIIERMSTGGGR